FSKVRRIRHLGVARAFASRYPLAARAWREVLQSGRTSNSATLGTSDPERAPPCAHAHARAREIIEEFSLGSVASPVRPTVSRARRYHTGRSSSGWCGNRAAVTTLSIWGQRPA